MANGMFKTQMDIDRQGPRLIPNNCKNLDPPYFSKLEVWQVFILFLIIPSQERSIKPFSVA
jgi:hypothetical protein